MVKWFTPLGFNQELSRRPTISKFKRLTLATGYNSEIIPRAPQDVLSSLGFPNVTLPSGIFKTACDLWFISTRSAMRASRQIRSIL